MLENKAQMKLNSTFWVFQKCTNSKLLITKLYKIVIYLHAVQVFKKCPCFLWHSPRFIGDVVETIVELGRYNETIGCHYKLADQRRQSCQERQKLGAAANNCNRCIFTEYSVFFCFFLREMSTMIWFRIMVYYLRHLIRMMMRHDLTIQEGKYKYKDE